MRLRGSMGSLPEKRSDYPVLTLAEKWLPLLGGKAASTAQDPEASVPEKPSEEESRVVKPEPRMRLSRGEPMALEVHRWWAAAIMVAVWLVCVAPVGFLTLLWMRECSTRATVVAVIGVAIAMLVVSALLALTGRATAGRVAVIVVASWIAFFAVYKVCNRPNAATKEYLRSLGDPERPRAPADETR